VSLMEVRERVGEAIVVRTKGMGANVSFESCHLYNPMSYAKDICG